MNELMKKTPQYTGLKFKSKKALRAWLHALKFAVIYLYDKGQDLQVIWIDKEGEILYCEGQSGLWCGKFIDIGRLHVDAPLYILRDNEWMQMDFIPLEIQ